VGLFWRAGGRVLISVFSLDIREYESVRQPNLRKSSRKLLREPTTMMNGTDPPTLDDIEKPPDLLDKKYAFETDEWLDPPVFSANLMKTLKINPSTRAYFTAKYRKTRTPTDWNRYVILGYLCYEDGQIFDKYWNGTETNWLKRHKMIWYQYRAHIDKNIDIPNKLRVWVNEVKEPYLQKYAPEFQDFNTHCETWDNIIQDMMEEDSKGRMDTEESEKKGAAKENPDPVNLNSQKFRFDTTEWHDPPPLAITSKTENEWIYRRKANDELYKQYGTATTWHRYITLGYYALNDGMQFDKEWQAMTDQPIKMHRIIWYNFLYQVDRDMDIAPKLNAWATKVSQPYLQKHDLPSLEMDTIRYTWKEIVQKQWILMYKKNGFQYRQPADELEPEARNRRLTLY
jgi:hypothetical protein